jgi:hypothetical protein
MQSQCAVKCARGAALGLALLLTACPVPVPNCEDSYTYIPQVDVRQLSGASLITPETAMVVGRIVVDHPGLVARLSVVVLRLEDGEAVAIQTVWLDEDGRFYWILDPGTYAIPIARLHFNYRNGSYQSEQPIAVNMRFDAVANEAHYLGTLALERGAASAKTHHPTVRNDLGSERASDPKLQRQGRRLQIALLEPDPGLPSYRVRPATGCSKWSNVCWLVMYGGGCLNARH